MRLKGIPFTRVLLLCLYFLMCTGQPAFANCTSPAATAGAKEWFTNTYKFCDGTNWISFSDGGTLATCSSTGQMEFTSGAGNLYYKVCDGTNTHKIKCQPDTGQKQIVLTTAGAGTWTVPDDWNSSSNTIEAIGAGGGGGGSGGTGPGKGAGGGAYGAIYNFSTTAGSSISIKVGAAGNAGAAAGSGTTGGDSWFNGATCAAATLCAKGGSFGGSGPGAGGSGGAANGAGTTRYAGGTGGTAGGNAKTGGGGGGAGGPNGNGANGGTWGTSDTSARTGGAGGGGSGGGLVGTSVTAAVGGTGGKNAVGTAGGAGGASGNAGTAGTNGSGGGGGGATNTTGGGAGGAGTEWDATHGSGGGGGGGGATVGPGAAGGLYGGGGAGGGSGAANAVGGAGAQGIVVITYVPAGNGPGNCTGAAGNTCTDGTIYAGVSPDGSVAMYTTAADAPGTYAWDNGTTGADTSMVNCAGDGPTQGSFSGTSCSTGQANTTLLMGYTDSAAPYAAATYCNNLVANGHSDWYLPANNELYVLSQNQSAIGGFIANNYWSSSEAHIADQADFTTMASGDEYRTAKSSTYYVRCVRKDTMVGGTPPACGTTCAALTTCTGAGKVDYIGASNVLAYCDGANWLPMGGTGTLSGLAAQWKMNENTGTTTADASGNSNTMTFAASTANPAWATGKISYGISFDNSNDYASAPNSASLNITGAITIMAWIKLNSIPAWGDFNDVITKGNDAAGRYAWQISIDGGGAPNLFYCYGVAGLCGSGNTYTETSLALTAGNWYHIAVAYNDAANTIVWYVNGIARTGSALSGAPLTNSLQSNTDPVRVGITSPGEESDMVQDDVRIYSRTLSAAEIAGIYNAGAGCP